MTTPRDYDREAKNTADHRYAYDFDFDVMHPYMVRAFQPFFRPGRMLELGSFKGDFTRRLLPHFQDMTCVEASSEAVAIARAAFGVAQASRGDVGLGRGARSVKRGFSNPIPPNA